MPFEVNFRTFILRKVREFALNSNKLSPNYSQVKICTCFSCQNQTIEHGPQSTAVRQVAVTGWNWRENIICLNKNYISF